MQIDGLAPRLIPITLGITGHINIDPEQVDRAGTEFLGLLAALREQYPNTPLRLLTSLAEGADRIAAKAFLAFKEALGSQNPALARHFEIVAPLPLPQDMYESDFPTSVQEFRDLISACCSSFPVPIRRGVQLDELRESGRPRDGQYQDASRYVASHADLLIAMWDGVDSGLEGGTSDTVGMRLRDNLVSTRVHTSPLARGDAHPVHHIEVVRSVPTVGTRAEEILGHPNLSSDSGKTVSLLADFQSVDDFNQSVTAFVDAQAVSAAAANVLGDAGSSKGPASGTYSERYCLELYATADALAVAFERRWRNATRLI